MRCLYRACEFSLVLSWCGGSVVVLLAGARMEEQGGNRELQGTWSCR